MLDLVAGVKCADQVDLTFNWHEWVRILRPELKLDRITVVKFEQGPHASEPRAEDHLQFFNASRRAVDSLDHSVVCHFQPR